jgi:hypothetical protein
VTAIVGLVDQGTVFMGGDSAGISGYWLETRSDPKVFVARGFLYGFTSSFRMGQLLRFRFQPPAIAHGRDLFEYMATDWIDAVRECFKAHAFGVTKDGQQEGGAFLVGIGGRLFSVHDDFQVGESAHGYDAVGCGREIAVGSLHATHGTGVMASIRIDLALTACALFSIGVRGPFTIKSLPTTGTP